MNPSFAENRRDLLKTSCALAEAAAVVSVGGSVSAPSTETHRIHGDSFVSSDGPNQGQTVSLTDIVVDAPALAVHAKGASGTVCERDNGDKVPANTKDAAVEGTMAYSAVGAHLGCTLTNWDAPTRQFPLPCHDALYDAKKMGAHTGGATCRVLPYIPLKQLTASWWLPASPAGASA